MRRSMDGSSANGLQLSAEPREVYFTEDQPAPDEPFCDNAFPIR